MRARLVRFASLGLVLGGLVGWGCRGGAVGFPLVAFRCQPSATGKARCPEQYQCCSDEPAFLGEPGDLLLADANNDASHSGMCIHDSLDVSEHHTLANGCPKPCNPTWAPELVAEACEPAPTCCQTVELHEDDCVFDETEGRWRPADGRDALASLDGGRGWKPTGDSTHQDPDFTACERLAGDRTSARFRECVGQLGTANQRGYCMALSAGQSCPLEDEQYVDPCEAMN